MYIAPLEICSDEQIMDFLNIDESIFSGMNKINGYRKAISIDIYLDLYHNNG